MIQVSYLRAAFGAFKQGVAPHHSALRELTGAELTAVAGGARRIPEKKQKNPG